MHEPRSPCFSPVDALCRFLQQCVRLSEFLEHADGARGRSSSTTTTVDFGGRL